MSASLTSITFISSQIARKRKTTPPSIVRNGCFTIGSESVEIQETIVNVKVSII